MYEARPTLDQARPMLVNTNSDETLFYPFTVSVTFSASVKSGEVVTLWMIHMFELIF